MNRALIILLAIIIDLLGGDPPNRAHPVAAMGFWLHRGKRIAPKRHRFRFGAAWVSVGTIIFAAPWFLFRQTFHRFWGVIPFLLKPMFAYRNLRRAVLAVVRALEADNLPEARRLLAWHLVSRPTETLSATEIAGATIESLAENLTDSLAAPLLAYAGGGLPAAWGYRFINTADAMWGYRTAEFEQLGKFAARADDVLNWFPARLTGELLVIAAFAVGLDGRRAAATMRAQHTRTKSPNAGWTMSAAAGALGVTLEKREVYTLSGGNTPLSTVTVRRAIRLADVTAALIVFFAAGVAIITRKFRKSGEKCD